MKTYFKGSSKEKSLENTALDYETSEHTHFIMLIWLPNVVNKKCESFVVVKLHPCFFSCIVDSKTGECFLTISCPSHHQSGAACLVHSVTVLFYQLNSFLKLSQTILLMHGIKFCPTASLLTTNPACTDLSPDLGLCGEKPATYCMSYATAVSVPRNTESDNDISI
jgi:hypothetical protein